jgi:hypothetical protein
VAPTEQEREVTRFGPRHPELSVCPGAAVESDRTGRPLASRWVGEETSRLKNLHPIGLTDIGGWRVVPKPREGDQLWQVVGLELPGADEMRVCRLTELASFTTDSGSSRMTSFAARAAAIRAGRDQATAKQNMAPGGGPPAKQLFHRVPNMRGSLLPKAELEMSELSLELDAEPNTDPNRARRLPGSPPPVKPEIVGQSIPPGTPVPEGTVVRVWVIPAGFGANPVRADP